MSDVKTATKDLIDALKTQRDEARVQLDLASAELRDRVNAEWSELEHKYAEFKAEANRIGHHMEDAARDTGNEVRDVAEEVSEAGRKLGQEIRDGYAHLRDRLKK